VRKRTVGGLTIWLALTLPAAALGNPTWLAPSDLSQSGEEALFVDAAASASGGATVVWRRSDGTYERVQAATSSLFGGFAPTVDVSPEKVDGEFPQVAEDAAGEATVVWDNVTGSPVVVEAATLVDGLPSAPVEVSTGAYPALYPAIAEDERGDAIVAWQSSDGKNEIIDAAFRPAGGSFGTPVALSQSGENAELPRVAIDAAGDATVVWQRYDGKEELAEAASRLKGAFGPSVALSEAGEGVEQPQVAMNAAGDTTVAWTRSNGTNKIVQAVTRPAGAAAFPSVATSVSAAGEDANYPSVALDAHGDPTLAWSRNAQVQVASGTPAGTFSTPVDIGYPGLFVSVAEDPAGDALVGYFDAFGDDASASFRPAGGLFTAPQQVSPPGRAVDPGPVGADLGMNVALDGQGDGVFGYRYLEGEPLAAATLLDAAGPVLSGLSIPASATAGTPVTFAVSSADRLAAVAATTWSFGDGSSAEGASVAHTFATPGTYTVSVTSTDAEGNATTRSGSIAVLAPSTGPSVLAFDPASLGSSSATANSHGQISLKVLCPAGGAACGGSVTLTLPATASSVAVTARAKSPAVAVTLAAGRASFSAAAGASRSVSIVLPAAVLKLLSKHRTLKLSATIESRGAAGQSATKTATLHVKAYTKLKKKAKQKKK
jgi:PKD domain